MAIERVMATAMPLLGAAEAVAAVAAALRVRRDRVELAPELAVRFDAVLDALGIRDAVNALDEHELEGVLGVAGGLLTQAADQVSNPARVGWDYEAPSILMAQGHLSSLFAGALQRFVLPALGADLEDRLRAPGASFLDIGVGVAALAIAMCRLLPELRVVGVDPWQPALALARENVAAAGLGERIELRELTAQALTDASEYDLAWLPTVFMPDPALEQATELVHAALHPGGWAILALYARPDDPLSAAVADLRTVRQGGAVRMPEELAAMLSRTGFAGVQIVTDPQSKTLVVFVVGRRPVTS
jgi:SAM-dependent methyltransferase